MGDDEEIDRENFEDRGSKNGVGAELVRTMALERLYPRLNAFCANGSLADIVALNAALELTETAEWSFHRAVVIEALLRVLRAGPISDSYGDNADCRM